MAITSFHRLMAEAEKGKYAVGYFEAWNLDSFFAVCDAAENKKSPVIIGFSGIDFPNYKYLLKDTFSIYANLINDLAGKLTVPVCTIFNESSSKDLVLKAIEHKFGIVMFLDSALDLEKQKKIIAELSKEAHKNNVAIEGEIEAQAGLSESITDIPEEELLTDISAIQSFVEETKVDALAVNIGQVSMIGEKKVKLNLEHLKKLKKEIDIPLVLHGGSSIYEEDIKKAYFEMLRESCLEIKKSYNIYKVIGSGLNQDVLVKARIDMQKAVEELMVLFGSAGRK